MKVLSLAFVVSLFSFGALATKVAPQQKLVGKPVPSSGIPSSNAIPSSGIPSGQPFGPASVDLGTAFETADGSEEPNFGASVNVIFGWAWSKLDVQKKHVFFSRKVEGSEAVSGIKDTTGADVPGANIGKLGDKRPESKELTGDLSSDLGDLLNKGEKTSWSNGFFIGASFDYSVPLVKGPFSVFYKPGVAFYVRFDGSSHKLGFSDLKQKVKDGKTKSVKLLGLGTKKIATTGKPESKTRTEKETEGFFNDKDAVLGLYPTKIAILRKFTLRVAPLGFGVASKYFCAGVDAGFTVDRVRHTIELHKDTKIESSNWVFGGTIGANFSVHAPFSAVDLRFGGAIHLTKQKSYSLFGGKDSWTNVDLTKELETKIDSLATANLSTWPYDPAKPAGGTFEGALQDQVAGAVVPSNISSTAIEVSFSVGATY